MRAPHRIDQPINRHHRAARKDQRAQDDSLLGRSQVDCLARATHLEGTEDQILPHLSPHTCGPECRKNGDFECTTGIATMLAV